VNRRVAVITGAGSGVGRAAAVALAAEEWTIWLAGRREATLVETAVLVSNAGGEGLVAPTDVTEPGQVAALFEQVGAESPRLDLLFNNAGRGAPPIAFEDLSLGQWESVVKLNLTAPFLCAQHAVRMMKTQTPQGGRIINNGSVSAQTPRPNSAPYTATKHAVTGLTKSIALDGRSFNITCGQIDIGNAATPMMDSAAEGLLQPDGMSMVEPTMDVDDVGRAVAYMAGLPRDTTVLTMTIMAGSMPLVGRG